MNRILLERFLRWYQLAHPIQQWAFKLTVGLFVTMLALVVTHTPSERPHKPKIILNCDHCGTDLNRTMTYNEYQDQREQQQRTWFGQEHRRIQQELWDERGRERWCRNHSNDRNCK